MRYVSKDALCSETDVRVPEFFCVIFTFWVMVDLIFYIRSVLVQDFDKFWYCFMSGGLRPQASDAFGLNPPSQLVIGYHWLTFLNQGKILPSPKSLKWKFYQMKISQLKILDDYLLLQF